MKIQSALFLKSLTSGSDLSELHKPLFAIVGRSNSGKSSLLNMLTNQAKLARTGQTPGVTRCINLFLINKKYYLADLPGFGFAKMSRQDRLKLQDLIFWFLLNPDNQLHQLYLLIDSKTGPTPIDLDVLDFIEDNKIPATILASKIDKLKRSERPAQLKKIYQVAEHLPVIPVSSQTQEGRAAVLQSFISHL